MKRQWPWSARRRLRSTLLMGASLLAPALALAQQTTIAGRVTGADGNPLADVRVMVASTTQGTLTNADGRYALRGVAAGRVEIRVLRVGYQEQKKIVDAAAGQTATLDFVMPQAIVKLQEVVTTAVGDQRKSELGNTVGTLGDVNKRAEETSVTNLGELMSGGKVAGVTVVTGNMTGSTPVVRIRGLNSLAVSGSGVSNAPIYIIDGIRMNSGVASNQVGGTTTSFLANLDVQEIEDVEIVKGPSAATLYGTDAANGVIVITTKKGRAGATRWNFFGEAGTVEDRNHYLTQYAIWGHDPAKPTTIKRCLLIDLSAQTCAVDSTTSLNLFATPGLSPIHTGQRNQYGMQVSGGTDAVRFFVSGDIQNEIGPVKMPAFSVQRFDSLKTPIRDEWMYPEALQTENMRANLSATLSPSVDLTVNAGFAKSDQRLPQVDNNSFSYLYNAFNNPGFAHPGLGYTGVGRLGEDLHGYGFFTPGDIFQVLRQQGIQRMIGSAVASWRPFSWMQNDGTVGVDLADMTNYNLCRFNECPNSGTTRQGSVNDIHTNARDFSAKVSSNMSWQARPSLIMKTALGAEYVNQETDWTQAYGRQLPPGAQTVGAAATLIAADLPPTASKTVGLFVQEEAAIRDRLWIAGAVRTDQNSAFGTNFQSVIYPKLSISWMLSDEPFFPRWWWLDQLHLRSAYGASGVQPGSTVSLRTFTSSTVSINNTDTPGLRADALGNPDLKPERSAEYDGGFDVRVLHERVNLELTYYSKQTHDALIALPIAPSVGPSRTSVVRNIASVKNAGIEATVNTQLASTRLFAWDLTISASKNSNKIVSLGGYPTIGTGTIRDSVGLPVNGWFFRPYTYADRNNDGYITKDEVTVSPGYEYRGYSSPRDIVSLSNGFDLLGKVFRVNVLVDYRGGFSLYNQTVQFYCQQTPSCYEEQVTSAPLWRQARNVAQRYETPSTTGGYLENGQFWRLRELSGTWFLPQAATRYLARAQGASLTFAARNLHVWTAYTGIDPESNYSTDDVQTDFSTTAPPTYFTLRLNLKY